MEPSGRNQATGCRSDGAENRSNKPIRNRWQLTATVTELVKRGSPSWRKEVESRESEVTQDSTSYLHEIGD